MKPGRQQTRYHVNESITVNLMRLAENAANGNSRQHSHQKLKYFNFLPSTATEFTTRWYVTSQMPHAKRKHG